MMAGCREGCDGVRSARQAALGKEKIRLKIYRDGDS